MTKAEAAQRINKLIGELEEHRYRYYVLDAPSLKPWSGSFLIWSSPTHPPRAWALSR